MRPGVPLVLACATQDGTALTNSTTPTSILHASGKAAIGAGILDIGSTIRATLRGRISTLVTSPGTLTLDCRLGPTANIVISSFGAVSLNTTAQSNASFQLIIIAIIRALGTGTSANALCTAKFATRALLGGPAVGTTYGYGVAMLPDTAPAVGTGFDSSVSNLFDIFATWSVANAANSIQVHQSLVELIN